MLENLIEKISEQQKGEENTAVWMIGEQLKDICKRTPAAVEIVLQDLDVPEMSIENAEKKIKAYADKQKRTGGCVCVPPNVSEDIIKDFYGIKDIAGAVDANSQTLGNMDNAPFIDLKNFL